MIHNLRYNGTGSLAPDYMLAIAKQSAYETIGMWEIIPAGRQAFGLTGSQLSEFIRQFIFVLITSGWVPVKVDTSVPGHWKWVEQEQYGSAPDVISVAIVDEWKSVGYIDPEWDSEWVKFVRREVVDVLTPNGGIVRPNIRA
jgi:hypothetical protein